MASIAKIKLLMLNYEFPPIGGGAGKAHLCILNQFAQDNRLQIDVLTSMPKPGFVKENFAENITIHKVGIHKKDMHYWRKSEVIEWLFKARRYYRKMINENRYDLAHAFFGFPTAWLCYKTPRELPYIVSLRGSDVPGYNVRLGLDYKLLAGLFRKIWTNASAVIANSVGLQKLALEFTPELDIGIIPNGIDAEKFHPRQDQNVSKPIKALTVCRLISRKRIDLLIKAVVEAKKMGLALQLNIAGEGNLTEQLKQLSVELGVENEVNFLARVETEQMPQLYRDNDVFVMSSAHEGMSNAMLEAMASGLPIVTTQCEGVEELIAGNGIVVDSPDAGAIARGIKKLADESEVYKQMSLNAVQQARKFTWQGTAQQYFDSYNKILTGGGEVKNEH
jgi:glycosyltransferase involved in cell wall biosynthesis